MTKVKSWQEEHGKEYDVPEEITRMINTRELIDMSWKNDVCPCFGYETENGWYVRLWVEHPDRAKRELGGLRYVVSSDREGLETQTVLETDRLDKAIEKWRYEMRMKMPEQERGKYIEFVNLATENYELRKRLREKGVTA